MLRGLLAAAALTLTCAVTARADSAPPFTFWPQAGVIGQDLYLANFVDLDPAAGQTLDPFCGHRTYDTHTGDDVTIRSFREESIGVPIFSATDGVVLEVTDGNFDWHYGTNTSPYDNHVNVEAPDGRVLVYGHLRHGIALKRGSKLRAGQQIGWNGSSGNSSWPHLHFTELVGQGGVRDAFAGPCRAGPSDFANQPQLRTDPYVRNLVVSSKPFVGQAQLPWDKAPRTGTFVRGARDLWFRVELGEYTPAPERVQVVRPDGTVAIDDPAPRSSADGVGQGHGLAAFDFHERVGFDALGTWHLRYSLDGQTLADAPLSVVAGAAQVRNRPPAPVVAVLVPAAPNAHVAVTCVVSTSLVTRDPDYDVVRYRYRWTVAGRIARSVTSAGLTDVLARDTAKPGETVGCAVTPSDGRLSGTAAGASAVATG